MEGGAVTDEEILDAAAAIIAKRARVLQLSSIAIEFTAKDLYLVRKYGTTGRLVSGYQTTPTLPTLGKAWTKEEAR